MAPHSSLLVCPKNLKECIDWVLRVAGKDGQNGTGNINNLKDALKAELKGSVLTDDLNQLDPQLDALVNGLESFIGYGSGGSVSGNGIGKKDNGGSYASSYNTASWPICGSTKQCPSCSSCHPSGSSTSCNGSCCPNCDVKKAAKIFLGFIPALYFGLKILYDKCKGDWKNFEISDSTKSLHRFLVGMGYDVGKLNGKNGQNIFPLLESLFNDSNGPLKKLYNVSKKYFTSSSSPSPVPSSPSDSQPKTVREILLWLSGLPFIPQFPKLLKHCEGLCDSTKNSVKFNNFETSLFNSCFLSPFVLGVIEGSKSNESEGFPLYKSEISKFSYPEDPSDLLEKLCEYTRKVFPPLKFLCMQCELDKDQGGWKDCYFGSKCAEKFKGNSSPPSNSSASSSPCCSTSGPNTYLCSYSNPDPHDHCKDGQTCLGFGSSVSCDNSVHPKTHPQGAKCKFPCPHPLQRFLCDSDSPFKLPSSFARLDFSKTPPVILEASSEIFKMGFSGKLSSTGRSGESLFVILDIFVGDSNSDKKVCFLRDLLRFLLCLTRTPPSTFGEIFSFYYKLAEWVEKDKGNFKTSLETEISSHPGSYDSASKLTDAVFDVYGSDHSDHSGPPYSLRLLSHCWNSHPNCGNFLFPLATNAWDLFAKDFADTYLSFICYLAKDFQEYFEKFQGEFSSSSNSCCSSSSGSQCKIVECPCALPFLYSHGFTFMKASKLNNKKCSDFIKQLGNFVGNSTLDDLIAEIEAFLWSIRLPFFLFVLAFWAFVISYFLYVQLYKLDVLELNSHDHPAWSFKIPPSILFSDASSKLKDLSYFSL